MAEPIQADEILDPVDDHDPEPIEDHEIDLDDPLARRPHETRVSNGYLQHYARMPPHTRTIAELGRQVGLDRSTLQQHRTRNDWDARLDAHDRRQRRIIEMATERAVVNTQSRYYRALSRLSAKLESAADNLDPSQLNASQIVAVANAISRGLALTGGKELDQLDAELDRLPQGPPSLESPGAKAIEKLTSQPDVLQAIYDAYPDEEA